MNIKGSDDHKKWVDAKHISLRIVVGEYSPIYRLVVEILLVDI